jgi:hypothetical protein
VCVWSGQPLAKLEFAIMITTLLRHYDIEVRVCIGVSCFVVCCAIALCRRMPKASTAGLRIGLHAAWCVFPSL